MNYLTPVSTFLRGGDPHARKPADAAHRIAVIEQAEREQRRAMSPVEAGKHGLDEAIRDYHESEAKEQAAREFAIEEGVMLADYQRRFPTMARQLGLISEEADRRAAECQGRMLSDLKHLRESADKLIAALEASLTPPPVGNGRRAAA